MLRNIITNQLLRTRFIFDDNAMAMILKAPANHRDPNLTINRASKYLFSELWKRVIFYFGIINDTLRSHYAYSRSDLWIQCDRSEKNDEGRNATGLIRINRGSVKWEAEMP